MRPERITIKPGPTFVGDLACYDGISVDLVPGRYDVWRRHAHVGMFGYRTIQVTIHRVGSGLARTEEFGEIMVDAGIVAISQDRAAVKEANDTLQAVFKAHPCQPGIGWDKAVDQAMLDFETKFLVHTRSGIGDGLYPLSIGFNKKNQVVGLSVLFMDDESVREFKDHVKVKPTSTSSSTRRTRSTK